MEWNNKQPKKRNKKLAVKCGKKLGRLLEIFGVYNKAAYQA